jgi:hypothetical protein
MAMRTTLSAKVSHSDEMLGVAQRRIEYGVGIGGIGYASRQQPVFEGPSELKPREDIWPTDKVPSIRRLEAGTNEFTELRWAPFPARAVAILLVIAASGVRRSTFLA